MLALPACTHNLPPVIDRDLTSADVDREVTVEGTAQMDQKIGSSVQGAHGFWWVCWEAEPWPASVANRRVRVTGTVKQRSDLPILDPNTPPDMISAGMKAPEGVSLEEARKRFVLENSRWQLLD